MSSNNPKLGRGLMSLMSKIDMVGNHQKGDLAQEIDVNMIRPNPFQPRKVFKEEEIISLANSIRENGLLSPIIVRKNEDHYQIIAGERRWRAFRSLGNQKIPVIVREASKDQMITLAIIENIQRDDLNPIECGIAFKQMMEELDLTQDQLAERLGKERSTVTNFIRLLNLDPIIQDYVSRGTLTMGHARALLGIKDRLSQIELAKEVIQKNLNVRQTENKVKEINQPGNQEKKKKDKIRPSHIKDVEKKLSSYLGTKVQIKSLKDKNKLIIDFFGAEDFLRLSKLMGVKEDL